MTIQPRPNQAALDPLPGHLVVSGARRNVVLAERHKRASRGLSDKIRDRLARSIAVVGHAARAQAPHRRRRS